MLEIARSCCNAFKVAQRDADVGVNLKRIAVAYSGGRDSTALLHATLAAAALQDVEVVALHVHHGLSSEADGWLAHCERQCARWARAGMPVAFVAHRLIEHPAKGESVEAWAREARYGALRDMALASGAGIVLIAHHQRDQAESLLLQALRGAGVGGLSGMPRAMSSGGLTWLRPWLSTPRAQIEAYGRRNRLKHIDDDSNADSRFARNRLRLKVWPALTGAFEQAEASLATSAQWAQQANELATEIAALDLAVVAPEQGFEVPAWLALSPTRRSNALRAWVYRHHGAPAPVNLVSRLLEELPRVQAARWRLIGAELRLHRGVLRYVATNTSALNAPTSSPIETRLDVCGEGTYKLPGWAGALWVERVRDKGVSLSCLAKLELRARCGGEQFQSGPGRPPRSLKKQFQSFAVPSWDRNGPLLYSDGQLVFVPGLGLDARVISHAEQPMVDLRWQPSYDPA